MGFVNTMLVLLSMLLVTPAWPQISTTGPTSPVSETETERQKEEKIQKRIQYSVEQFLDRARTRWSTCTGIPLPSFTTLLGLYTELMAIKIVHDVSSISPDSTFAPVGPVCQTSKESDILACLTTAPIILKKIEYEYLKTNLHPMFKTPLEQRMLLKYFEDCFGVDTEENSKDANSSS